MDSKEERTNTTPEVQTFTRDMLLLYIKPSKSGPEAQMFLIANLIVTFLRGVGQLFSIKNNHKRPIYDKQKTVLKFVHKFTKLLA